MWQVPKAAVRQWGQSSGGTRQAVFPYCRIVVNFELHVSAESTSQTSSPDALHHATVAARTDVTGERFAELRPLVADIFERLAPHPTFTEVDLESDVYRTRGTASPLLRDPVADIQSDPLVVLSTSQANITALAYFFAMGWAARDAALPFLLLDDPLQAMDDVNVLGFSDLCRHLRKRKQLILSVHEKRFGNLLERKLAPRTEGMATIMLDFLRWDRSGPTVKPSLVSPQVEERDFRFVHSPAE